MCGLINTENSGDRKKNKLFKIDIIGVDKYIVISLIHVLVEFGFVYLNINDMEDEIEGHDKLCLEDGNDGKFVYFV